MTDTFLAVSPTSDLPLLTLEDIDERCGVGMSAGFFTIVPEIAEVLIEQRNPVNRTIRAAKSEQIKGDIVEGRFYLNGESIIFSDKGMVSDGQHRLSGCAEGGVAIRSLVVFGIPEHTVGTVDQGSARRPGDVLSFAGVSSAFNVAAAARNIIAYNNSGGLHLGSAASISRGQVVDFANENPEVVRSIQYGIGRAKALRNVATVSAVGTVHYLLTQRYDRDQVEAFLDRVTYGDNISRGSPPYATRDRLQRLKPRTASAMMETMLRGWLYELRGAKLTTLPVTGQFPKLIDVSRREASLRGRAAREKREEKTLELTEEV